MFSLINGVGDNLLKYLETSPEAKSPNGIEMRELSAKYTTDCVATCAFGLDAKSLTDPKSEFREMGRKFLNTSITTSIRHMMLFVMPSLASILRVR